jgi:ABC-type transport system substrate-binding protein
MRVLVPAALTAALLLSGCTEETAGTATPATSSSSSTTSSSGSSSSAPPTVDPELEEFCTDGEALFAEVDEAFDAAEGMGVEALVRALQQAVAAFDALDPPAEIADDWEASRDGFSELTQDVAAIDPAAPDAQQQAEAVLAQADTTVGPGFQRVGEWIDENCPNA